MKITNRTYWDTHERYEEDNPAYYLDGNNLHYEFYVYAKKILIFYLKQI
ncbi:MAG: hypothetical protein ACFE8C_04785 [Promethearchaeota archaeon]